MLHHPSLGGPQFGLLQFMIWRALVARFLRVEAAPSADRRRIEQVPQQTATIIDLAAYRGGGSVGKVEPAGTLTKSRRRKCLLFLAVTAASIGAVLP